MPANEPLLYITDTDDRFHLIDLIEKSGTVSDMSEILDFTVNTGEFVIGLCMKYSLDNNFENVVEGIRRGLDIIVSNLDKSFEKAATGAELTSFTALHVIEDLRNQAERITAASTQKIQQAAAPAARAA